MRKMLQRIISIFLVLALCMTPVQAPVFADEGDPEYAFTKQPAPCSLVSSGFLDYGWETNFSPTKIVIMKDNATLATLSGSTKKYTFYRDTTSTYYVRAYYSGGYVQSEQVNTVFTQISFISNGSRGSMDPVIVLGTKYTVPSNGFYLPPGLGSYEISFKGWANENRTSSFMYPYEPGVTIDLDTSMITLSPMWHVTLRDKDDKEYEDIRLGILVCDMGDSPAIVKISKPNDYETHSPTADEVIPPETGLRLAAWKWAKSSSYPTYYPPGNPVSLQFSLGSSLTLLNIAFYKPIFTKECTLSFDPGDGSGTMDPMLFAARIPDADAPTNFHYLTLPECTFTPPEGKYFYRWNWNGEMVPAGYTTFNSDHDEVLTAEWTQDYTVHFDANGGSGTMDDVIVPGHTDYTLPPCAFTPPRGYKFRTWRIVELDMNRTPYNTIYEVTKDLTIQPVWEELPKTDMSSAVITAIPDQTFSGEALEPAVEVIFNGEPLIADLDYTVSYTDNVNAGTATVTVTGTGMYSGEVQSTFTILPKAITPTVTLSKTSYTYNGSAKKPSVTVKDGDTTLVKDVDYTVKYASGRINVGTYKVTVTLKGNYSGSKSATFTITPKSVTPTVTLSKTAYTFSGTAKKPGVTVKDGDTTLVKDVDYTVKYASGRINVGKYKVTVTLKGNYTGTKSATFKINPKGTTLTSLTAASQALTVKWEKQSTKMASSRITGYQIQLATNSGFTSNKKTVTVSGYDKVSKKVTGLKGGKKYYVRIRTYKTVSGTKYYSSWSKAKTQTTKK